MRLLLFAFLFLFALLAALLAGLITVRHQAAEMAIRHALAAEGITNVSFQVETLDQERTRVEDVVLGQRRNLRAKSIEVRFTGLQGWDPRAWNPGIADVRIVGLRLNLNTQSRSDPLDDPDLDRLLGGPNEAEVGEAAAIPPLLIEDAEITLGTAEGESRLRLDGSIVRPPQAPLAGQFTYGLETPLGRAEGAIEIFQDPDAPLRVTITAENASLKVEGNRIESLVAAIELVLPEDALPSATGQVELKGISPLDGYVEKLSIALSADPTRIDLDLEATAPGGGSVGQGKIAISRVDSRPQINADLTLNAAKASTRLGLVEKGGALTLESQLTVTLPPLVDLMHKRGGKAIQLLETASLASRLKITADRLTVPGKVLGLSAGLHLNILLEDARLRTWVSEESRLSIAALDPEGPLLAKLPEDTRRALWRNLKLTLPLQGDVGLQALAERKEEGIAFTLLGPIALSSGLDTALTFSGRLDSRLDSDLAPQSLALSKLALSVRSLPILGNKITELMLSGDASLDEERIASELLLNAELAEARQDDVLLSDLKVSLPLSLASDGEDTRVALDAKGSLSLGQVAIDGDSLLRKPASFEVERIAFGRDGAGHWRPSLAVSAADLSLLVPGENTRINISGLEMDLTGTLADQGLVGTLTAKAKSLSLPSEGVSLVAVRVEAPLPPDRMESGAMAIEVGGAALSADGQRFSGMTLQASLTQKGDRYRLTGKGRGPNGQGRIAVTLTHDLTSERGSLEARWGPITFKPNGLQPKRLSKQLEDLDGVSGQVSIEAKGERSPRSSNISARLQLKSFSATLLPVRIEGLDGDLRFASLSPLVTLKNQQITIEDLDVGVPLSDLLLTFDVADTRSGPALDAKTLQADFAGGRLVASPFRVAGPEDSFSTTVEVTHVKLDRLTDLLDLDDIQLEGRVIGQLPVNLDLSNETIAIANGWLQAVDEGVIRIPDAAERLGLGEFSQQQKDLLFALEALSDFHYTYLYATVSLTAGSDLDLALTLEGKNPAVLEGYPFKFNVTFAVDLADLLAAFAFGREITPELFDGAWGIK